MIDDIDEHLVAFADHDQAALMLQWRSRQGPLPKPFAQALDHLPDLLRLGSVLDQVASDDRLASVRVELSQAPDRTERVTPAR
ncbi:MAG: hypothetical protein H0U79_03825 [Solirubrobacterales bacterium]|nr:hypothetical protein [Solirubrobacterales bacterium]